MKCKLQPKFARVLIRREKIRTSIIIPDEAARRNAPAKGTVVAVGPACDEQIKPGMTVIFGQYAGAWINGDGSNVTRENEAEYFVCQDEDVIAEVVE